MIKFVKMEIIRLEILEASYWEHFKIAKDLAMYLPLHHPKRLLLEQELNKMIKEINEIKDRNGNSNRIST